MPSTINTHSEDIGHPECGFKWQCTAVCSIGCWLWHNIDNYVDLTHLLSVHYVYIKPLKLLEYMARCEWNISTTDTSLTAVYVCLHQCASPLRNLLKGRQNAAQPPVFKTLSASSVSEYKNSLFHRPFYRIFHLLRHSSSIYSEENPLRWRELLDEWLIHHPTNAPPCCMLFDPLTWGMYQWSLVKKSYIWANPVNGYTWIFYAKAKCITWLYHWWNACGNLCIDKR